ncbi:hypothetical protein [Flavobacterium sp. ACAM 123]|uniref:hypothetical protein n=1 Tax=Flavobacterium sp. ACAM 123 TaxID=1189620 RepID=UPI00035E21BC|nr:hypothetical protein [Flavobacterium sp. ACAM 123]
MTSLNQKIEQIPFLGSAKNIATLKSYSKILCYEVFNIYTSTFNSAVDFTKEIPLRKSFIIKIIPTPKIRSSIMKELNNNGILITDGKYIFNNNDTNKKIGGDGLEITPKPRPKHYKFHPDLIYNSPISFTYFEHFDSTDKKILYQKMKPNFDMITISHGVYNFIPKMVEEKLSNILIGDEITDPTVTILIDGKEIPASRDYWLNEAVRHNKALIKFNDNFYIDSVKSFIDRKRTDLIILHTYNVRKIQNKEWYCSRNKTNKRLDHNLTCIASELFEYVSLKGVKTVEIDLVNSQFAFLSNISNFPMDDNFIKAAQEGYLYELIMEELGLEGDEGRLAAKKYMMLANFGRERNHPKVLNKIFPILMQSITEFKQKNGYAAFSIMLQNAESSLMITTVLAMICAKRIPCLSIHDSIRVRPVDYDRTLELMQRIFDERDFKCKIKNK